MKPGVEVSAAVFRHEADLIVLSLKAVGIDAWLVDQHMVSADPLMSNAVGGIKIHVGPDDVARALSVLAELKARPADGDGCLSCGAPMAETEDTCASCGWSFLAR
jgi:hypothetical protein